MPLPAASESYRQKFVETIASQMPAPAAAGEGGCPFIGFRNQDIREVKPEMLEAQLLWDHSMALAIARSTQREPGESMNPLVVHICGAFHCAHGLGIPEALPRYWQHVDAASSTEDSGVPATPWLPIDEDAGDAPVATSRSKAPAEEVIGPKASPPGVVTVVCWPGAVEATLALASSGKTPGSLGRMGDWTVVTEETWADNLQQT